MYRKKKSINLYVSAKYAIKGKSVKENMQIKFCLF